MLKLVDIRNEKGISRAELSRISGVPLRTLEDLEKRGDGRISTLYKIAISLNMTLDDLYNEEA